MDGSDDYGDEDDFEDDDDEDMSSLDPYPPPTTSKPHHHHQLITKKMGPNFQPPSKNLIGRSYIINTSGQYERIIRKRKRKSSEQLKILMREFEKNPNWSKETLLEVSKKTGLSEA